MVRKQKNKVAYRVVNDIVFQAIFGSSKDTKLLICLLNAILENNNEEQVKELEVLNPFSLQRYKYDKKIVLDIKAKDKSEKVINIEVQLNTTEVFRKRIVYYNAKTITEGITAGEQYETVPKVITIAIIANTILLEEEKAVQNVYKFKNTKTSNELTDLTEIHIVELQKFDESKEYGKMTRFERWLYYLKKGEEISKLTKAKQKEIESDEEIKMAIAAYKRVTNSKKLQWVIEAREKAERDEYALKKDAEQKAELRGISIGEQRGISIGEQRGISIGEQRGKIESGLTIYKLTKDIELSAKAAGITSEEFKKYIN